MFFALLLPKIGICVLVASLSAFAGTNKCDSLLVESARIDSIQASFLPRPPYPTAQAFREDEMIKVMRKNLEPDVLPCLAIKAEKDRNVRDSIQNAEMRERQKARKKQDLGSSIVVAGLSVGAVFIGVVLFEMLILSMLPGPMDP